MDSTREIPLATFRQILHAHPELSGQESETQKRIREQIQLTQPDQMLEIGETGLAAVYHGKAKGPSVLLRADIDALPIQEINSFAHKSKNEGVSHKCGHDGHSTTLLGVARELQANPPEKGRAILLFQPAEETGEGAKRILEDPEFSKITPDFVFAQHNLPGIPKNVVVTKTGTFSAAVTTLIFRIEGKTAHAAEPENGQNPIYPLTEIVRKCGELQQNNPAKEDFQLLTPVYQRVGSPSHGIAPGDGELHLTLRTWDTRKLEGLCQELTEWANVFALGQGFKIETERTSSFAANLNDPEANSLVEKATRENGFLLGERNFPFRWGEDFGLFTDQYRGAMFGIGAGDECPALHNPDYDFPDDILPVGIKVFNSILKQLLY